ncbi:hypothetical protein [Duganella sp. S19_KUP01_CR8]|uniref:hypothetical protein n=1 Tax=Duganella sp. S19_KUP01_CR8 TaxID=3025502 RepID=UPI002FCD956A
MSKEQTKRIIDLASLGTVLLGVIGIISAAYLSEKTTPVSGSLLSALASGLTTVSVSLIGFAVFNFAIETKDWKSYFGERIKEVVIENDYLSTLSNDALKETQTRLLKAQFKNQSIDKEGSFLHYFHHNLHRFISEPFREDVSAEVHITAHEGTTEKFVIQDKVTYVCRASRGTIQSHVGWQPDDGEFEEVVSLKITVSYPPSSPHAGKSEVVYPPTDANLKEDLKRGISVPLDKYKEVDFLIVKTEAEYIVRQGSFQYWQMAHPTKNFQIAIVYPQDFSIQFKTLVLEDVGSQITEQPGYLRFAYTSWALPQSGLTWLIRTS